MKYFVVFVAIIAFQFVSVSASPEPEPALLNGLGGILSGVTDLVGNVLKLLTSLLRGLLSKDERNYVDTAAVTTEKEFNNIIRAARRVNCPVTRYDMDDAIEALKKIAVEINKILASINEKTLASYSDKIATDLKAGQKSLNAQLRVVVQIAVDKVRPGCARNSNDLNNIVNLVINAAGKVTNAVQVQLFRIALYDVYKNNLIEDVTNVVVDKEAMNQRYDNILGDASIFVNVSESVNVAIMNAFVVSYRVFSSLTELKITNDPKLTQQTLEAAITSIVNAVRVAIKLVSEIRPKLSAEDNAALDRIIDMIVATSAAFVNTIQTYRNPLAIYDIYQDASLFPQLYKKEYELFSEKKNWKDAQQFCRDLALELASIENEDENTELVDLIVSMGLTSDYWLGGTDATTGNWIWIDTEYSLTYTNWRPNEPNSAGSCMAFGLDNQWFDESCTLEHDFVCQDVVAI